MLNSRNAFAVGLVGGGAVFRSPRACRYAALFHSSASPTLRCQRRRARPEPRV